MKYALYYWIFEPLRGGIRDNPTRAPTFSVPVMYRDRSYDVSILSDEAGVPEAIRLRIPNLEAEQIPEELLPLLQVVKEHLLTTLRLTYREDVQLFPMSTWAFFDDGKPYEINLQIDASVIGGFNADGVKGFFLASFPFRHEVRLLVDGNDSRIPVQYRYLSYYKLIEHEFKSKGQWKNNDLKGFLAQYEAPFRKLGHRGTLIRHLHELRDRCAHIRTGNVKEIFGVNSLNHKETQAVSDMLPLLRDICRDLLNSKATKAFRLGDIRPWYECIVPPAKSKS